MNKSYTLTINEEQAKILVRALDLYSRIGIGQFEQCLEVFDRALKRPLEDCNACRESLNLAKWHIAGFLSGGSYGIHSPEVDDEFRAAFDMKQVVRHRLAYDRKPEGDPLNVNFDTPSQGSKLPLPTIETNEFYYCAVHDHEQTTPCPECNPPKVEP